MVNSLISSLIGPPPDTWMAERAVMHGHFPQGTGPSKLISTKGIFAFDAITKEMYLAKVHPGISVAEIKKRVPWDLKIAPDLDETERPTDDEIDFIRRFAPGESIGKHLLNELVLARMEEKAK